MEEKNKMDEKTTIKTASEGYEAKVTDVISVLDKVSVNLLIREETFTDNEGKEFTVNLVNIDEKDFRVPNTVLKQLKLQLEENPKLSFFKVKKEGEGLNTSYTVIPLN